MNEKEDTGKYMMARETVINLANCAFELVLALIDSCSEVEIKDTISLKQILEKNLMENSSSIQEEEKAKVLTIIREIDSLTDHIEKENSLFSELQKRYNDFVDENISKTVNDKDKRYQIATNFFSYIVDCLIQKELTHSQFLGNLKIVRKNLTELEDSLYKKSTNGRALKMKKIIEFAEIFERTIGKSIKEMNIDIEEILPKLALNTQT